jgi:hypothetical protein
LKPAPLRVTVARVAKTGTNSRGPWTLYIIKFSNGAEGTTFCESLYRMAAWALDGCEVDATFRGRELVTLTPVVQQRAS